MRELNAAQVHELSHQGFPYFNLFRSLKFVK